MIHSPGKLRFLRMTGLGFFAAALAGCAGFDGLIYRGGGGRQSRSTGSVSKILPVLVQSLKSENPETRLKSLQALETMGSDAGPAAKDVIYLLDDPDQNVRAGAADALVKIGEAAVNPLIAALQDMRFPAIRKAVFPVLARMGPTAKPAIPDIRMAMVEGDKEIETLAAAADNVIGMHFDRDSNRRGKGASKARVPEEEPVPAVVPRAPQRADPPAAKVTGPLSIHELIAALKEDSPDFRRQAVNALEFKAVEVGEVLPVLIHVTLNDPDSLVRRAAAAQLKKVGPQPASALILGLQNLDARQRGNAADALGVLGPVSPSVLPALIDAMLDPKVGDRAIGALAQIGPEAVPDLVRYLGEGRTDASARQALVRIGRPAAKSLINLLDDPLRRGSAADILTAISGPVVPELISSFKVAPFEPRAEVLVRIGKPAIPSLIAALRLRGDKVRQGSGMTLCEMGPAAVESMPAFLEVLKKHPEEVEVYPLYRFGPAGAPALMQAAKDDNPDIRLTAFQNMGRLSPPPKTAIPAYVDALHDPDSRISDLSIMMIKGFGFDALPALTEGLVSRDKATSRSAAEALGFIGAPAKKALGDLRNALLSHPDDGVRKRAAYAIGQLGANGRAAVNDLIQLLDDDRVRWWASEALKKIGPSATSALENILKADDNPLRFRAALLLNTIAPGNEKLPVILTSAMTSSYASVRYQAALALGENPGVVDRAIPALLLGLNDEDGGVRFGSAFSLGKVGGVAVAPLLQAAQAPEPRVAEGALQALRMLDGNAAPTLVEALQDKTSRGLAGKILLGMGAKAVPSLVAALGSRGPRSPVGRVLVAMGDSAVPALVQSLAEGRDSVRKGAVLTLKAIGTPAALAAIRKE